MCSSDLVDTLGPEMFGDLSLDATSFIQFLHEITEGEAREEI